MPRTLTNVIYGLLIIVPPAMSHYLHLRHFALTLSAVGCDYICGTALFR